MTTLVLETEPVAVHVTVTEDKLTVDLADGRSMVVPLVWYPRLVQGSPRRAAPLAVTRRWVCDRVAGSRRAYWGRRSACGATQWGKFTVICPLDGLAPYSC